MRAAAPMALLAGLALAGCDGADFGAGASGGEAVRQMALLDGAVTVAGPEGYCVDPRASRARSGFAMLAGCALVSGTAVMPQTDALLTVQVGAADSAAVAGNEQALAALLSTAAGVALLSASGRPEAVRVDALDTGPGIVVVHFADTSATAEGLEPPEWRAFLDLGGRLTTVGVRGFVRRPLDRAAGLRLLYRAVDALRAANRPPETPENG